MPLSRYFNTVTGLKEPLDLENPIEPTAEIPAEPTAPKSADVLREYMAKWESAKAAKAPTLDQYNENSADRAMLQGITRGANTIANRGNQESFNFDEQLKADENADLQDYKSQQDQYQATQKQGAESLKAIPELQEQADREDPNSLISSQYKQIAQKLGLQIDPSATAKSLEKLMPMYEKVYGIDEGNRLKREEGEANRLAKLEQNKKDADFKLQMNKDNGAARAESERANQALKAEIAKMQETGRNERQQSNFEQQEKMRGSGIEKQEVQRVVKEKQKVDTDYNEGMMEADKLKDLLKMGLEGNPTAASASRNAIAMMFNKGALTDRDVAAFAGSQNVMDTVARWANKTFDVGSELTSSDLTALKAIGGKLEQIIQGSTQRKLGGLKSDAARRIPNNFQYVFGEDLPVAQNVSVAQPVQQSQKTVVRTGKTKDGRSVIQYSDGTREVK